MAIAVDPAPRVLPAHRVRERVVGVHGAHGPQELHLLVADRLGAEVRRSLHAQDGEQLHDVVLDDVAQRPRLLVEAGAGLDADGLGDGDLHVVDVLPAPQGLEDAVAEPEDEEVLDGLLAEVVVDAVDALLGEDGVQLRVQLPRRGAVVPERLLDDHADRKSVV